MKTLYLNKDSAKTEELKLQMTDTMWMSIKIQYGTDTYLLLEDNSKVTEVSEIVKILGGQAPPVTRQLRNARKAAVKIIDKALKTGVVMAPKEIVAHRRSICAICPYNQKKFFGDTCMDCGCNIKSKTTFLTESCPQTKW